MTTWVALTGGIGSGKSHAARLFQALGVPIIDADTINRHLISTPKNVALDQIAQQFGTAALDETGCLNRAYMRQLIFNNKVAKQQLENILHPLIIADIRTAQQHHHALYGIVELPTLVEHPHFHVLIQRVLLIHSLPHIRIQRVIQRSGLSEAEIKAIMTAQATDAQRCAIADDIIHNNSTLSALSAQVNQQHIHYKRLFTS